MLVLQTVVLLQLWFLPFRTLYCTFHSFRINPVIIIRRVVLHQHCNSYVKIANVYIRLHYDSFTVIL
jgi:hypothetical protein